MATFFDRVLSAKISKRITALPIVTVTKLDTGKLIMSDSTATFTTTPEIHIDFAGIEEDNYFEIFITATNGVNSPSPINFFGFYSSNPPANIATSVYDSIQLANVEEPGVVGITTITTNNIVNGANTLISSGQENVTSTYIKIYVRRITSTNIDLMIMQNNYVAF